MILISIGLLLMQVSYTQSLPLSGRSICNANPSRLILLNGIYTEAMTSRIVKNIAYIDSLPFDGIVLNGGDMWNTFGNGFSEAAFKNTAVPYSEIYNQLQPLAGKFRNLKHFFIQINVVKTADFFDDWTVIINNWRLTARALKAAGPEFVGIFFDNEEYTQFKLWNYPDDVDYKTKSLTEYIAQARLRGKQIMEACLEEFPEIVIISAHGPYWSESKSPLYVTTQTGYIELAGPFFTGMVEAQSGKSLILDGGENYKFRTAEQFEASYQWRKYTIASQSNNSPNIPESLRSFWQDKVSISYGVSDVGTNTSYGPMNPSIMRTTLENALNRCDNYVWYYPEAQSKYILQPGAYSTTSVWIDSIRSACIASNTLRSAPDLVVTNISTYPENPESGQDVTFSATIKNQGNSATPDGLINSVLFTIDGTTVIASNNMIPILAGDSVTMTANGGFNGATWTATDGTHEVDVWVNNSKQFTECDTENNHLIKMLTIGNPNSVRNKNTEGNEKFTINPNPVLSDFTIKFSTEIIIKNASMKIYDLTGREVKTFTIFNNETIFNKGELKSGMYYFCVINNNLIIGNEGLIVQ